MIWGIYPVTSHDTFLAYPLLPEVLPWHIPYFLRYFLDIFMILACRGPWVRRPDNTPPPKADCPQEVEKFLSLAVNSRVGIASAWICLSSIAGISRFLWSVFTSREHAWIWQCSDVLAFSLIINKFNLVLRTFLCNHHHASCCLFACRALFCSLWQLCLTRLKTASTPPLDEDLPCLRLAETSAMPAEKTRTNVRKWVTFLSLPVHDKLYVTPLSRYTSRVSLKPEKTQWAKLRKEYKCLQYTYLTSSPFLLLNVARFGFSRISLMKLLYQFSSIL